MSTSTPVTVEEEAPDSRGKFSLSEDWLATVVGLILMTLILVGVVPAGIIP